MSGRYSIGNLPLDAVTLAEALERIRELVRAGEGGVVVTPNVDHVMLARQSAEFASAYADSDLALVDGVGLLWAARMLGFPIPEKVSGSDLVWPLLEMAARSDLSVYLLGGANGSAEIARDVLAQRLARLRVVGIDAPWIDLDEQQADAPIVERIANAAPDLLLVGLGAPKQEIWIRRNRQRLGRTVSLGVGASIDFIAGRVRRAPPWVSQIGLEWLFRLAQEPRRLAFRYLVRDPGFLLVVGGEMVRRRRQRAKAVGQESSRR